MSYKHFLRMLLNVVITFLLMFIFCGCFIFQFEQLLNSFLNVVTFFVYYNLERKTIYPLQLNIANVFSRTTPKQPIEGNQTCNKNIIPRNEAESTASSFLFTIQKMYVFNDSQKLTRSRRWYFLSAPTKLSFFARNRRLQGEMYKIDEL